MICVAILLAWLAIAAAIVALIWRNAANKRAFEALREADRRAAYWRAMFEQTKPDPYYTSIRVARFESKQKPGEAQHDVETRRAED